MKEMLPVAILAGGLATRMSAVANGRPKALLPVAGEPFIAHQLRLLRRERIRRVVLCIGHLGELIQNFVGDGSRFGLDVCYSFDGERLLGTGGALQKALPHLGASFFVLYGDSYLDISYRDVQDAFAERGAPALMTVFRNEGRWDRSNVFFENGRIICYDKRTHDPRMQHIDYGLGVVSADVIGDRMSDDGFDLADLYVALVGQGRLAGYEVTRRFYEIGTPQGWAETDGYLRGTT